MKRPKLAPAYFSQIAQFSQNPTRMVQILMAITKPTVDGKYVHWEKLKHYSPPAGLSHEEWWFGLKTRRTNATRSLLQDVNGQPFTFLTSIDPLPECQHHIDSLAHGTVTMLDPIVNADTKTHYLMRSLLDEAITSSQLEGASTTREVAKQMIREGRQPRDRSEQMIYNNYTTMQQIKEMKDKPLTAELVFQIHRMVTDKTLDDQSGAGRFRHATEEIIVGNDEGEIYHVPPPASELDARMQAMCRFANDEPPGFFIHPLIRSMILHFWLAYDHPFIDGNGRTARALFYWSMLRSGYWLFEYVSISKTILKGPVKYGTAFLETETDENDLTYFLLYHADVVRRAIDELYEYIDLRGDAVKKAQAGLRGLLELNHRQKDLIGHALRHPGQSYTTEGHRNSHQVVNQTARTDLLNLVERRLFSKRKIGRVWYFTPAPDLEERLRN